MPYPTDHTAEAAPGAATRVGVSPFFIDRSTAPAGTEVTFTAHTSLTEEYLSESPLSNAGRIAIAQDVNGQFEIFSIGTDRNVHRIVRDATSATGWASEQVGDSGTTVGIVSVPSRTDDSTRDRVFTVSVRPDTRPRRDQGYWWFNEIVPDIGGSTARPLTRIASTVHPPTGFDADVRALLGPDGVSLTAFTSDGTSATAFIPDHSDARTWARHLAIDDDRQKKTTPLTSPPAFFACSAGAATSQPLLPLLMVVDGGVVLADGVRKHGVDAWYYLQPSVSPPAVSGRSWVQSVKLLSLLHSRAGAVTLLAGPGDNNGSIGGCCLIRPQGTLGVGQAPTWPAEWTWLDLRIQKGNAVIPSITAIEGITTASGLDAVFVLDGIDGGMLWVLVDETGTGGFGRIEEIAHGIAHFTVGENPDGEIVLVAVTHDHELLVMTRSTGGEWSNETVALPSLATATRISAYRTTARAVETTSKAPVAGHEITIASSTPVWARVNGRQRRLDAHGTVTARTSLLGEVAVSVEAEETLAAPVLTFTPSGGDDIPVAANRDVVELLKDVTGPMLGQATDPFTKSSVVPAKHQNTDDLDVLAASVRAAVGLLPDDLTSGGPLTCAQAWMLDLSTGHPVFRELDDDEVAAELSTASDPGAPDFSLPSWGDMWEGVKTGATTVVKIVVGASTFGITLLVDKLDTFLTLAFDHIPDQVFDVIGGLFTMFGSPLGKVVGWLMSKLLGFLGWDDIVANAERLASQVRSWARGLKNDYPDLASKTDPTVAWLTKARADMDDAIDTVERSMGVTTLNDTNRNNVSLPDLFSMGGASMWGPTSTYISKLLEVGGSSIDLPDPPITEQLENLLADSLEELLDDAEQLLGRFTDEIVGLATSGDSLGQATITAVLETLRTVVDAVLELAIDFVEFGVKVAQLFVDGADDLVEWLETTIDIPFFTGFYQGLTDSDLNVLSLVCLSVAIPMTPSDDWADLGNEPGAKRNWDIWKGVLACLVIAQLFTMFGDNVGSAPGPGPAIGSSVLSVVAFVAGGVGAMLVLAADDDNRESPYWWTSVVALCWDMGLTVLSARAQVRGKDEKWAREIDELRLGALTIVGVLLAGGSLIDYAVSDHDGQETAGLMMSLLGSLSMWLRDLTLMMTADDYVLNAAYTGGQAVVTLLLGVAHYYAAD